MLEGGRCKGIYNKRYFNLEWKIPTPIELGLFHQWKFDKKFQISHCTKFSYQEIYTHGKTDVRVPTSNIINFNKTTFVPGIIIAGDIDNKIKTKQ